MFAINYDVNVGTMHVNGNVVDATGAFACTDNEYNSNFASMVWSLTSNVVNVTTPASNYGYSGSAAVSNFRVGNLIGDHKGGSGFVTSKISSFGTYQNSGTILNTSSCVPGVNAGCGTFNIDAQGGQPGTIGSTTNNGTTIQLAAAASIDTLDWGSSGANRNWSIGGSYASGARQFNSPGVQTSGSQPWGQVSCP